MGKKYEIKHQWVKKLKLGPELSQVLDSAIDHIGSSMDKSSLKDYAWLACFILGTYSIYCALLQVKFAGKYTIEQIKKINPIAAFMSNFIPFGIGGLTTVALYDVIQKVSTEWKSPLGPVKTPWGERG